MEKLLDQVVDSGQFRDSEMDPATRTTEPTHGMIVANREFFDRIEREQGIHTTVHKSGRPSEYFFAGYSFD